MKAERKQLDKGMDLVTGVAGKEHHGIRRDEFAHHLPAGSAWRAGRVIQICNCNGDDTVSGAAFADGAEEGIPLRAAGQPEGDILDIATGSHGSIVEEERRAYTKSGVRRIGMARGFTRGSAQAVCKRQIERA